MLCAAHAQALPAAPATSDRGPLADVAAVAATVSSCPQPAAPVAVGAANPRAAARVDHGNGFVGGDVRGGGQVGFLCSRGRGAPVPVDRQTAIGALRRRRKLRAMRRDELRQSRVRIRRACVAPGRASFAPGRFARVVDASRGSTTVDDGALKVVGGGGRQAEEKPPQDVPARCRPRLSSARQQEGPWPPRRVAAAVGTPGDSARVPQGVRFINVMKDLASANFAT